MIHPSINTPHLILTPCRMSDVDELHRVMRDPQVMRHIGKGTLTHTEVQDIVARSVAGWNETGMGWWTIRLRNARRLIGQICLKPAKDLPEIEVGFALDAAHWRQGYGKEALEAIVAYGVGEKAMRRIVATVRPENTASRLLLEACDFVRESDVFLRGKTLCLYARSET